MSTLTAGRPFLIAPWRNGTRMKSARDHLCTYRPRSGFWECAHNNVIPNSDVPAAILAAGPDQGR